MIVLFKNIPDNSYHNDISNLVEPLLNRGWFRKRGEINNIEIIALQEIDSTSLEFQALANLEPDIVAFKVIKKLHGMFIRGHRVVVREFYARNWKNDRRANETPQQALQFRDRRKTTDRRRKLKTFKIALPEYQ